MAQINFTLETLKSLQDAYMEAVDNKKEVFEFEGHQLYTSYAYYLISYLEDRFFSVGRRKED